MQSRECVFNGYVFLDIILHLHIYIQVLPVVGRVGWHHAVLTYLDVAHM